MNVKKRCKCVDECKHNYSFDFKHKGEEYRESTGTHNHKLAVRVAEKRKREIIAEVAGLREAGPAAPTLTTTLAADYLVWAKQDHPLTADTKDVLTVERFLDFVARQGETLKYVHCFKTFDFERWRSDRVAQVGRSSVNREWNVIATMFRQAREWGMLPKKELLPTHEVRRWRTDDPEMKILSAEEMRIALSGLPRQHALMCRVTLECLPRISEVITLTRDDVGPTWLSRRLKGGKRKRVGITAELSRDLRAELRRPGQHFIFEKRNKAGEWAPPLQRSVSCAFTRLFRKLEITGISHHSFRHTGVTLMLDAGINPRAIQQLAGWASLKMLQRYGHVQDAELQRAVTGNAKIVADIVAGQVGGTKRGTRRKKEVVSA